MDQPRKAAKPARGQKNKEIKCPCRYISGNMCIYMYNTRTAVCIYLFFCERSELLIRQVHKFELGCIKKLAH